MEVSNIHFLCIVYILDRSVASDEGKGTFLETLSVDGGQLRSYWIPSNRTGAVNEHQLGVHKYLMTNL